MTNKLLLFDLDWTLIYTGGAGVRALDFAFEKLFQIPNAMKKVSPDGKTDPAICREMIRVLLIATHRMARLRDFAAGILIGWRKRFRMAPGTRFYQASLHYLRRFRAVVIF